MTQNVILNLKSPQAIQTDIAFTQGDYGEAKLTIAVKDNEQYITGDTGASISFLRADGNIVTGDLTGTKGMYAYTFKGNELEAAGKIVATVTIKYTGGRVSAAAFAFTVRYNPTYDRKIPAGPYITELEKIKEQAQTYVEYLSALIEQLQPDIGSTALTKADLINGYTQTVAGIKAFDAAAAKTLKELVDGKIDATKIVNNLLSTDASMVLSAAIGPIIDQRLTDLLEKYNRLNGEIGTRKVTGVIKDNTRRGLYCGMDFSDAPADGWLVLIYCFIESNSTGFCIAFGVNGKSEGHIYGFIYSGGWADYVINFC